MTALACMALREEMGEAIRVMCALLLRLPRRGESIETDRRRRFVEVVLAVVEEGYNNSHRGLRKPRVAVAVPLLSSFIFLFKCWCCPSSSESTSSNDWETVSERRGSLGREPLAQILLLLLLLLLQSSSSSSCQRPCRPPLVCWTSRLTMSDSDRSKAASLRTSEEQDSLDLGERAAVGDDPKRAAMRFLKRGFMVRVVCVCICA